MRKVDSSKVVPFEQASLPNVPYIFVDGCNNPVLVTPLDLGKHTPHDPLFTSDPQIYSNVGYAVRNADDSRLGRGDERSVVKVYRCDDFLEKIDHPAKNAKKNISMVVAVRYDDSGDSQVVTYYDKPKGVIW